MKFSGVTILQGVEFSIFPIDFEWALQQCSAAALPVIPFCFVLRIAPSAHVLTAFDGLHRVSEKNLVIKELAPLI